MKIPYLAPAALLVQALLAPAVSAQTMAPDFPGNVSTLSINLTVHETIGGHRITAARQAADANRGIEYPDTIRYDFVYNPGNPAPALLNPIGWNTPAGTNYVERVTSATPGGNLTVTANGAHAIHRTRYTNATLINDLVSTGRIPAARGYRLVAVRFDVPPGIDWVHDTGTHLTLVRPGLYFFAEAGANDPAPVFIGAEDNVYAADQLIDFASFETVESGRYVDRFTDTGAGFDYQLVSDAYNGLALAEFALYRRPGAGGYFQMRAGGVFNWRETYDNRNNRNTYTRGPITGRNLTGPGGLYAGDGQNTGDHESIVTGAITMPAAAYRDNLRKYMDAIPPIANP